MSEDWRNFSFVGFTAKYFSLCTDAPVQYAEHTCIIDLGHAMGRKPINLIQPEAVYHNIYSVLIGESTWTRKNTSQGKAQKIYPYERTMSAENSPEKFVALLSENPERLQFLGEFTGMIKGIKGEGYMARFAEVYNDIHGCPEIYERELMGAKGKKAKYTIRKAYLSVLSTVTPEMLKENLTNELMMGGYLARYMLVYGEKNPRPRGRLYRETMRMEETLRDQLRHIIEMDKDGSEFILSDQALAKYNEIEQYARQRYEKVPSFVGRYLNYVISYADILLVSDAIGVAMAQGIFYDIMHLRDLVHLESSALNEANNNLVETNSGETLSTYSNYLPSRAPTHWPLIVARQYVERAWRIIEPCLMYVANELADYIELDKSVARLMQYMKKVGTSSHSRAMQNCHLNKREMDNAVSTLLEWRVMERDATAPEGTRAYRWIGEEARTS